MAATDDEGARKERQSSIDAARARELHKYFRPPVADADPPDTVLTAHAQLVAWRLDAQRAMVSLIDRETQYFVAESTKTLHLDNSLLHDHPDDGLWAGCVNVPKAGRLCEHTIATLPPPGGGPACFEVLDLSNDDRFSQLSFVAGPPHFRYYVGVPLRTKKGINIGSIFALDDKAREPIAESAKQFLSVMGENVVRHLEMIKDKRDKQRSTNMNLCLSAFVDPEHQSRRRRPSPNASPAQGPKQHVGKQSPVPSSPFDSDSSPGHRVEMDENLSTFCRAAGLLRDGLELEDGGGVVFLDTIAARARRRRACGDGSVGEVSSSQTSERDDPRAHGRQSGPGFSVQSSQPKPGTLHASHTRPAEILAQAHSSKKTSPWWADRHSLLPMSPAELSALIKRHPRGKLFTFETGGLLVSSSSDEQGATMDFLRSPKSKKTSTSKTEIDLVRRCFPIARQIIFLPLWDSTTSRWSACFVYNCCEFRNFSHNPEFLYCIAFSNCITTEISRLATLIADQQKSDFIGSISHELRSPLHGILASCEFLGETECSSFQRSLVDTADGCARTLLDTINMVLDYSKINAFEKNIKKARKSKRDTAWGHSSGVSLDVQSHLNIYGDVDIAAITEEVVEGVAIGHFFRDSVTNLDENELMDTDPRGGKMPHPNGFSTQKANVNIVVDIPMRDWTFWSQVGALRRIVMNLFSNSLKYTKEGFIKVKLEAEDARHTPDSAVCTYVTLSVTDSGQGMSPEYMRTKLFTPFAQESSIAPGTGLGLSLVKSIVSMLNGDIDVTSTLDFGTEVTVRLPMMKNTAIQSSSGSGSTAGSSGNSIERVKDNSLKMVQEQAPRRNVATYWKERAAETKGQYEISLMMRKSVERYLHEWYGFRTSTWDKSSSWDIIVTEEVDVHELIATAPQLRDPSCKTTVLVLCNTAASHMAKSSFPQCHNFEEIRHPFGPYKFARGLWACLERLQTGPGLVHTSYGTELANIAEDPKQPPMEEVIESVETIRLSSPDGSWPDINIISSGNLSAREDSASARMVMTPLATNHMTNSMEFPFPVDNKDPRLDGTVSPTAEKEMLSTRRPPMAPFRRTISATRQELRIYSISDTNALSSTGALTNVPPAFPTPTARSPRMLLVDDNKINLKLLQTFMKKRKYVTVTSAQDGLEAVNAYENLLHQNPGAPPDIILMDISMPVMNGFEATRRIREIEREYCAQLSPMQTPSSCLIIALTGLASARDQSEAFTSGFDMYITKPVSFAEISRLLDNWEANGGGAQSDGVPHGPVTAAEGDLDAEVERVDAGVGAVSVDGDSKANALAV